MMVAFVVSAYRACPHSANKFIRTLQTFGRETKMPVDLFLGRPEEEQQDGKHMRIC